MQKLQVSYLTWPRPDANGLFDYQACILSPLKKISLDETGTLYRDEKTFNLIFFPISQKSKPKQTSGLHQILRIFRKDSHYFIESVKISKEPLCKIVSKKMTAIHQMRLFDNLRLGKVEVQVLQIGFKVKKYKSRYEEIQTHVQLTGMSKLLQITPSFYEQSDMPQSLIQENPSCRYCHSKTVSKQNPFIVSCLCNGHTRYIHEECLLEWIVKRGNLCEIKGKSIFYLESKLLRCQLCKQFFDIYECFKKIHNYQTKTMKLQMGPISDEIMIIHFKYQCEVLFFIDVSKNRSISVGRSLECEIVLNQLSVSRQHAFFQVDYQNKTVFLRDNESKFGTLVQVKKTEVECKQTYQIGRSQIMFQTYRKKSFFDKFGFCVFEQKLRKEKKKNYIEPNRLE